MSTKQQLKLEMSLQIYYKINANEQSIRFFTSLEITIGQSLKDDSNCALEKMYQHLGVYQKHSIHKTFKL